MQDVITDEWMRTTASGLLIVALNKTELNGNGMLQLTHAQKKSHSLLSSHSTSMPLTSASIKRNLKQFRHSSWTWQPYIHWGTCKWKRVNIRPALTFLFCELVKQTWLPYPHVPCEERETGKKQTKKWNNRTILCSTLQCCYQAWCCSLSVTASDST